MTAMRQLSVSTTPDSIGVQRVPLNAFRNLLDIFYAVFPNDTLKDEGKKPGDAWKKLRDEIDDGYEKMGHFGDLRHIPSVDPAEVKKLRGVVLSWGAEFFAMCDSPKSLCAELLALPSSSKPFYTHTKDGAPKGFYWGKSDALPSPELSAEGNLRVLLKGVTASAIEAIPEFLQLDKIYKDSQEEVFHSFRKRIRVVLFLANTFHNTPRPNPKAKPLTLYDATTDPKQTNCSAAAYLPMLSTMHDVIGQIHDYAIGYTIFQHTGQEKEADQLKEKCLKEWMLLKKAWKDGSKLGPADVLNCLLKHTLQASK